MDRESLQRTQMLLGEEAVRKLENSRVAVFGIGGVGSFAVEGLVRCGIGSFLLVDDDVVAKSNINRQLHATQETVGRLKTEVMRERMLSLNETVRVQIENQFVLYENIESILTKEWDYVVDALDTVTAKLAIAERASALDIPVISAMGTGNKLEPAGFRVADIYETKVCPLCRVMRRELKKRGISGLKVVYSEEEPRKPDSCMENLETEEAVRKKRAIPGSVSFVPSVAGLILAGEVVKDLTLRL